MRKRLYNYLSKPLPNFDKLFEEGKRKHTPTQEERIIERLGKLFDNLGIQTQADLDKLNKAFWN